MRTESHRKRLAKTLSSETEQGRGKRGEEKKKKKRGEKKKRWTHHVRSWQAVQLLLNLTSNAFIGESRRAPVNADAGVKDEKARRTVIPEGAAADRLLGVSVRGGIC